MKILIAYDGSACADAAIEDLRYAGLPAENDLMVVSVAHAQTPLPQFMKDAEDAVKLACAQIRFQFPAWNVWSDVLWGAPANMLHQTILRYKPELVLVGSHGRSAVGRLLLGSVSLEVVRDAPCSVRVVRLRARKANDHIRLLVATDGSLQAMAVVEAVARRSWPGGTRAHVVSVAEPFEVHVPVLATTLEAGMYASGANFHHAGVIDGCECTRLKDVADESANWLQGRGLAASAAVLEGHPHSEIVAAAKRWHADTVFVGARGWALWTACYWAAFQLP